MPEKNIAILFLIKFGMFFETMINMVSRYISDVPSTGLWICHAQLVRLVHRTCRTSRFFLVVCPGTSKNNKA